MGLKKIIAHLSCDKCGSDFTALIPNDASAHPTVFEGVRDALDQCMKPGSHVYEEGGYDEGEFYGPCCWDEVSEKIFIQEIRDGKVTEEQLTGFGMDEYRRYLPSRGLPQLS